MTVIEIMTARHGYFTFKIFPHQDLMNSL